MDSLDSDDDNSATRTINEEAVEEDETNSEVQADVEEQEDEQENPKLEID